MRVVRSLAVGLVSVFGVCATAASSEDPSETILVEGSREQVLKQVQSFVAKVTRTDGELIGRWRDPICPVVTGLSDTQNEYVRSRLLEVEAKVRKRKSTSERKCNPNIFVLVTNEADEVLNGWKDQGAAMFRWKTRGDILHSSQAGPVRVWHNAVELRSDDGPWVSGRVGATQEVKQGRLKDSRIVSSAKEAISAVVVLMDAKQIGKKATLAQTADYIAMVSLSQIDLTADVGVTNSILQLFVEGETYASPPGLTDWDYAFLNALYRVGYFSPMKQRMDLSARMGRELAPR